MRARKTTFNLQSDAEYSAMTVSQINDAGNDGRNYLMKLTMHAEGRRVVDENNEFRAKITAHGFTMNERTSAAGNFLKSRDGLQILLNHSDLRVMLNTGCLNEHLSYESMSNLLHLVRYQEGIELLAKPEVRQLVSAKGLNSGMQFRAPLYFLTQCEDGIALFADDEFRKKISVKGLNARDERGAESVLANLCAREEGRKLLLQHKDLRNKIDADALNANPGYLNAPLFQLCGSETGISVLASSRKLRRMIDINSFNRACSTGENKGASPLLLLLESETGRALLLKDRYLRSLIEPCDLRVRRESDNSSVADLLIHPSAAALLKKLDPKVREEVEKHRQQMDANIPGWHSSARLFAPQKKSPRDTGEIQEEKRKIRLFH